MSHPSADDMRDYLTRTAQAAADMPQGNNVYESHHQQINEVLDQMDREGGPSHGQHS